MTFLNVIAIAVALAMDAFAVAVATGIKLEKINWRQNFRLAWHFGFFQAAMPIVGWTAGVAIRNQITRYEHWVAFALLVWIAQGMLRESFRKEERKAVPQDPTRGTTMIMLSLATSLDALVVGFSLSLINVSIWYPTLAIGIVAALFTTIGMRLGTRLSKAALIRRYADCAGGLVLLAIGLNILYQHGVFDAWWKLIK